MRYGKYLPAFPLVPYRGQPSTPTRDIMSRCPVYRTPSGVKHYRHLGPMSWTEACVLSCVALTPLSTSLSGDFSTRARARSRHVRAR